MSRRAALLLLLLLLLPFSAQANPAPATPRKPAQSPAAKALRARAVAFIFHSQPAAAIPLLQQAYPLDKAWKNTDEQGSDLLDIGDALNDLSRPAQAISYFQRARTLYARAGDRAGEAGGLEEIGIAYEQLSRPDKAIAYYQQARPLLGKTASAADRARNLLDTGVAYDDLSNHARAIALYQQALPLYAQTRNADGQGSDLMDIGNAYNELGQPAKALAFYRQALPLLGKAQDSDATARDLMNVGIVGDSLHLYNNAIVCFQDALTDYTRVGDVEGEALDMMNDANAEEALGSHAAALTLYQQALPLYAQIGDSDGAAIDRMDIGVLYGNSNRPAQAIPYYQQALPGLAQAGDRTDEATILSNLMLAYQTEAQPRVAAFYGKQSVNVYQSIRADIETMDTQTQQTYLNSVGAAYRTLADLLISQGRLPEAEQTLDLLKVQEQSDYLRGPVTVAGIPGQVDLTPDEQKAEAQYQQIASQVTALGRQQQALLDRKQHAGTLSASDQANLDTLTQKLAAADSHLSLFLSQLSTVFGGDTAPEKSVQAQLTAIGNADGLQDTLRQLHDQGQDVVVLETLVAPDRFAVIVTTANSQKVEQYPITSEEFNKKVAALQAALRDPNADPTGPANDLYKIVFAPLEADLAQAHATTLMWSLDGSLRYIPIPALYDGKQYLVQRFDNEVFTLGSQTGLGGDEHPAWNALGLGVTQAQTVTDPATGKTLDFPALSDVAPELHGVVRDVAHPQGALPGRVLLDRQFSRQSMADDLQSADFNVVHIASHFALHPGDLRDSFLLLGDGTPWSLADISHQHTLFAGVDLLALSACDTASGGTDGDGREVDSLGSVAQRDGAKSVLASLWPVADTSTQLLMDLFYRWHETHPKDSKAEALRQAQLSLLTGTAPIPPSATRGISADNSPEDPGAPAFKLDPKAPYAHPFYWAPFVLIGNWR